MNREALESLDKETLTGSGAGADDFGIDAANASIGHRGSSVHLMVVDSPRLELLENGFGLGQFQAEVRTDGSVQITRDRVIISSGQPPLSSWRRRSPQAAPSNLQSGPFVASLAFYCDIFTSLPLDLFHSRRLMSLW
jgi:hypothetical protein